MVNIKIKVVKDGDEEFSLILDYQFKHPQTQVYIHKETISKYVLNDFTRLRIKLVNLVRPDTYNHHCHHGCTIRTLLIYFHM